MALSSRLCVVGMLLFIAATSGNAAPPPSKILELSSFILTLPENTNRPGNPDEIPSSELQTFTDPQHFFTTEEPLGVAFRAECGAATTKNSKYPRCELREMTKDGSARASWSTDDATAHRLQLKLAITHTPAKKPHVVCAQIHDADDDLLMIRLEGKKLFIERNDLPEIPLDNNYQLGSPFEITLSASQGQVQVWHNGQRKLNWQVSRRGCYFKAGCYTQSNPSKGDSPGAFGQVVIYRLER